MYHSPLLPVLVPQNPRPPFPISSVTPVVSTATESPQVTVDAGTISKPVVLVGLVEQAVRVDGHVVAISSM